MGKLILVISSGAVLIFAGVCFGVCMVLDALKELEMFDEFQNRMNSRNLDT